MKLRLLLLLFPLVLACGGDAADPHVLGACEGWTDNQGNPFTGMCEAACNKPPQSTGEMCDTTKVLGCAAFTFDESIDGCCVFESSTIRFYECVK